MCNACDRRKIAGSATQSFAILYSLTNRREGGQLRVHVHVPLLLLVTSPQPTVHHLLPVPLRFFFFKNHILF